MSHEHEDVLRERAAPFIEKAKEAGFEASVGSVHPHMLKVAVERDGASCGNALLYYKSSKDTFSLKGHEMSDEAAFDELKELFGKSESYESSEHEGVHAYVDGSWMEGEGIGYGYVVIRDGSVLREAHGHVEEHQSMRQVTGELKAVMEAVEWFEASGVEEATVHYDYEGIEKWATEEWRAKNVLTKKYRSAVQNTPVTLCWQKEDAHSGVKGNERADALAKRGARLSNEESELEMDPMEELRAVTKDFLAYARQEEEAIDGDAPVLRDEGIYNNQYNRVVVADDGAKVGCIDVYNTSNQHLAPRIHGFQSDELQEQVERLWKQFRRQQAEEPEDVLAEAKHYYDIFRPYREQWFDFGDWAKALERACEQLGVEAPGLESSRYDFGQLEETFSRLQEKA